MFFFTFLFNLFQIICFLGTITLDSSNLGDNLDIVGVVSQFHLEDIKAPLISKTTKLIDNKNVFTVLDMANLYNLQDLIDACHMFLDKHAGELKLSDGFNQLSQVSILKCFIFLLTATGC